MKKKRISYWKYIKPNLIFFILGPILMLTEVAGEVIMPRLMSSSLKFGVAAGEYGVVEAFGREWSGISYIILIGVCMLAVALLMLIGGVGGSYCATRASTGFAAGLRKDIFHRIQDFSFSNIDSFSTGSLVTRLTNDVTQMQNITRSALVMMLRAPGMMIGAVVMAINMNASLAKVILYVVPVMAIAIAFILKSSFPRFSIMQKKIDRLNSAIRENLTNVRVVKSLVREDYECEKFYEANEDLKDNSMKAFNIMIIMMPIMSVIMNATTLVVVLVAGKQIIVGDMPVEDLTAFTTYTVQILSSLMMLSMIFMQSSRAMASSKRIKEVLCADIDLTDVNCAQPQAKVTEGKIEFKNVSFRYFKNSEGKVLDNVNLTIEPGTTVGIIGSTGSGKTTLVQMIPRLYDTDEGEVLVDGVNVKDYKLENLRNGVGMVLQKNVLFSGTIEENLMWGDREASEEEMKAAAQAAQASLFIDSFKDGYATDLGQGGVNLSGGQKQRLCIARALLKKPKILILDDSTSAVDTATEAHIREAFRTNLKDTTKLIIAQRISSVQDADCIVVLDEGCIVGKGTHEELLASCEEYQEICYSQMDKEVSA